MFQTLYKIHNSILSYPLITKNYIEFQKNKSIFNTSTQLKEFFCSIYNNSFHIINNILIYFKADKNKLKDDEDYVYNIIQNSPLLDTEERLKNNRNMLKYFDIMNENLYLKEIEEKNR